FTTHTPVAAGHDRFDRDLVSSLLGEQAASDLDAVGCLPDGELNMTILGMTVSRFVNAVAFKHRGVSRAMFPAFGITSVTNGVHLRTWAAPSTARMLDAHIEGWAEDNSLVRYATTIPLEEVAAAHASAKAALLARIAEARPEAKFDPAALTIGLARRAAAYKRLGLLFRDPERLRAFVSRIGTLQVVCSGKAHPDDAQGKAVIRMLHEAAAELAPEVGFAYLENYTMGLAREIVAGSDIWLNTPERPLEASGTSGMKAAVNGVPSLSILDGWWIEGAVEGVTGWSIGGDESPVVDTAHGASRLGDADEADSLALQDKLALVGETFYSDGDGLAEIRRSTIALNGSFFTSQRMFAEYAGRAYSTGRAE
ncbi:MAG TPA: alpha-glucan family phosphorylase, partial [Acidimicrobiales bacterium]|nr:alpha-glucan family phosphorylase [Acidimicrobiales bacterium]